MRENVPSESQKQWPWKPVCEQDTMDDHGEVFCIIMAKSVWAHALSIRPGWAAQTPHPEKDLGGYYFPVPWILFSTRVKHNLQPEWEQTMLRGINLETKTQHMSCYTWKAKSRHSLRPTDPSPTPSATQSLCLGEAYLYNVKEGKSLYFPTTAAQKCFILGVKLFFGFCT